MSIYRVETDQGTFDVETDDPSEQPKDNSLMEKAIAGPVARGVEALQKGISVSDVPSIAAKSVSSMLGGVPEFIANRPVAGPIQAMDISKSVFPKAATPEGDKLGNELGTISGFVPAIEVLQSIVAPAARKGAAVASNRLMTSVLKPGIKQMQKDPDLGLKAAKMGLTGTKGQIAKKAEKLISDNEVQLQNILDKSSGNVDAVKVADVLEPLKRPFANTGDDASVAAIEKVQETLKSKGTLTAKEANQLKRDFYSGLRDSVYGPGTGKLGASVKAEKGAARGLKEAIESVEPSVGSINRKTGVAGMVRDAVERQDLMDQRKNVTGLIDSGLIGGGIGTGNPLFYLAMLGRRAAGSSFVKSKLAELLSKMV